MTISVKKRPVDLQVLDFTQCFNAIWLEESLNYMYDGGLKDDMLPLLFKAGRNLNIAVKTPNGLSGRKRA